MRPRLDCFTRTRAVMILCGLLSSTVLNMFVAPTLYRRFGALTQGPAREIVGEAGA